MADLIKREDAIELVALCGTKPIAPWTFDELQEDIQNLPSAEKQGEWINLHNGKWKCTECGIEVLIYAKGNFCPNCGADMRKGIDDESY